MTGRTRCYVAFTLTLLPLVVAMMTGHPERDDLSSAALLPLVGAMMTWKRSTLPPGTSSCCPS